DAVLGLGPAVAFDLGPGGAGVGSLPEGRAGAAAVVAPPGAAVGVAGGVEGAGADGVHGDIGEAGIGIDVFRLDPGFAAVGGFVQAALRVSAEEMAVGRDVDDVGIGGIHHDARDGLGIIETEVSPVLAAIGSAPHAVA